VLEKSVDFNDEWFGIEEDLKRIFGSFIKHYGVRLDAEDVAQDVWLVCNDQYNPQRGSLKSFAVTVGRNMIAGVKREERRAKKYEEALYVESRSDVLSVTHLGDNYRHIVVRNSLEDKALEPILSYDEWNDKWLLIKAMMQGQSTTAQVLWVMYTHLLEYNALPSAVEIADYLGVTRQRVYQILDEVVATVKGIETMPVQQTTMESADRRVN